MPDNNLADGSVLTSTFYNTNIREQVVTTVTSSTRPTGVDGRVIYETDTGKYMVYSSTAAAWSVLGGTRWVTYTPSWTNLTVGNGTQSAAYRYVDGGMVVVGAFTFGSTSSISGSVSQAVPNSESMSTTRAGLYLPLGGASLEDTGTLIYQGLVVYGTSATSVIFSAVNSSATYASTSNLSSTIPHTWTTSDIIRWQYFAPLG